MRTILDIATWAARSSDLRLSVVKTDGELHRPLRIRIKDCIPAVVHGPARPPKTALERAMAERQLAGGPQPACQLIDAAKSEGISKRSLDRAKRRLEVRSFMESGRWWWGIELGFRSSPGILSGDNYR